MRSKRRQEKDVLKVRRRSVNFDHGTVAKVVKSRPSVPNFRFHVPAGMQRTDEAVNAHWRSVQTIALSTDRHLKASIDAGPDGVLNRFGVAEVSTQPIAP